jgi:hypothetical protein
MAERNETPRCPLHAQQGLEAARAYAQAAAAVPHALHMPSHNAHGCVGNVSPPVLNRWIPPPGYKRRQGFHGFWWALRLVSLTLPCSYNPSTKAGDNGTVPLNEIEQEIRHFQKLNETQIYEELSQRDINRYYNKLFETALNSLSPYERGKVEKEIATGAGLYGPASFLIGRVERETAEELKAASRLRPSASEGEVLVTRIIKQLQDLLCDDWGYCKKKKEYKDDFKLLVAAAAIAVKTLSFEVGVVTAALVVTSFKGPDFFCNCSARETENATPGEDK